MKSIVIVDDEVKMLAILERALGEEYSVKTFSNPEHAFEWLKSESADLVISDIRMKEMSGIELLQRIRQLDEKLPVILMTAWSSVESAVTAIRVGASDYLLKPFELEECKSSIAKILKKPQELFKNEDRIVYGKAMKEIEPIALKAASNDVPLLICGEPGTGKEFFAKAIHNASSKAKMPIVEIPCENILSELFEPEVFGNRNDKTRYFGLLEQAKASTAVFDEIFTLSAKNQAALLKCLKERQFTPIGRREPVKLDCRLMFLSSRSLETAVKSGSFSEELMYKVSVLRISLPPLRERREDMKELTEYFLSIYTNKHGREPVSPSPSLIDKLASYKWPGNLRQLEHVIERAVILSKKPILEADDIELPHDDTLNLTSQFVSSVSLPETLEQVEEQMIIQALEASNWNYSQAASMLGVTRQNFHYRLRKYGIKKDENQD